MIVAALTAAQLPLCSIAGEYEIVNSAMVEMLHGASGGDELRMIDNGDRTADIIHIFTNTSGTASFSFPASAEIIPDSVRLLVVAGGGSGGSTMGGGGGGGGVIAMDAVNMTAGMSATVTVGSGALAVTPTTTGSNSAGQPGGRRGSDSKFAIAGGTTYSANGGCGGKGWMADGTGSSPFGSGAGGSGNRTGGTAGTAGQGYSGGNGLTGSSTQGSGGGGGGGAGGAGSNCSRPASSYVIGGKGGDGVASDISGETLYYGAGGGGGAGYGNSSAGGAGGKSGDATGNWGKGANRYVTPGNTSSGVDVPVAGQDGFGGGGGGGTYTANNTLSAQREGMGAKGGNGTVIVRYTLKMEVFAFANGADASEVDGEAVYTYTDADASAEGKLLLLRAAKVDVLVVGGGGSGANAYNAGRNGGAGGGGAGGFVSTSMIFNPGTYTIKVGAGGLAPTTSKMAGNDGEDSYIQLNSSDVLRALKGGGGGYNSTGKGGSGTYGSGGGGSKNNDGGVGTAGQGNKGGKVGSLNGVAAGGGGAGGVGGGTSSAALGGSGGNGRVSDITGQPTYYAAGGGGSSTSGTGGAGGYGADESDVLGGVGGTSSSNAGSGKDGTGSGGGGKANTGTGGNGGSGIVIIRIKAIMPEKPPTYPPYIEFDYDGEEHLIYEGDENVVIVLGSTPVDRISVRAVGEYVYTATPKDGFCWADGTSGPVECRVKVKALPLEIYSLSVEDWQAGETPATPQIESNIQIVEGRDFNFVYSSNQFAPISGWTTSVPTSAGAYYVTAVVNDSDNYTPPAQADIPVASFTVWGWESGDKYLDSLGYHAKITISGYTAAETLTDFPMLVRVGENSPNGFQYRYTNGKFKDGGFDALDLRFIDSETGEILPCEAVKWDEDGESLFWVKVPDYANGKSITMCWGELVGKDIPAAPAASDVWSSYAGVWHMDEDISSLQAQLAESSDSSGNKNHMKPTRYGTQGTLSVMTSTNGVVGNARVTGVHGNGSNDYTWLLNSDFDNSTLGTAFTVSGWFSMTQAENTPRLFSAKDMQGATTDGWEVQVSASARTHVTVYGYGSTAADVQVSSRSLINGGFIYITVVYDGETASVFAHGAGTGDYETTGIAIAAPTATTGLAIGGNLGAGRSFWGFVDEARVRRGVVSANWAAAEYAQMADSAYYGWSHALVTPNSCFKNRWIVEPEISKREWPEGGEAGVATTGEPAYGESAFTFTSAGGSQWTNDYPTAFGGYSFGAFAAGGSETAGTRSWSGLLWDGGTILISMETPYQGLAGDADSSTEAGRVLLANDYAGDDDIRVDGQEYDNTNPAGVVYWVHDNADGAYINIKIGSTHSLMHNGGIDALCGSTNIWYLEKVRLGNYYPRDGSISVNDNFLPGGVGSVNMMLQNVEDAAIYSPCYTNGIGTIYFDAVNEWNSADGDGFHIIVEVATNCVDETGAPCSDGRLPTDENSYQYKPAYETYDYMDDGVIVTNHFEAITNRFGFADWQPADMRAIFVTNGTPTSANMASVLALDVNAGGSDQNFYRVAVPLNYRCPARFRIRRVDSVSGQNENTRFVLVDNVLVSFPAMRVDLESYGKYDETRGGKQTLGQEGAWSVPFPSAGDGSVYARAKPVYTVNPGHVSDIGDFVLSASMHYRWRYLEQVVPSEWRTVVLDHTGDFGAKVPLALEDTLPGDLEYWFELKLNAPYYSYFDYAYGKDGPGLGDFYTENISTVANRATGKVMPSCGTDWFVRLREGRSDYEGVNIVVRKFAPDGKEQSVTNTVEMELVGDHIWRGYMKTMTETNSWGEARFASFKFRIEALNRQTPGDTAWATNTTCWKIREDAEMLPISETMVDCDTNEWSSAPYDTTTGYYLFQVDDSTRSLTVVHADYQDFNAWNDAGGQAFVGSSTEDAGKSGASAKAISMTETFDDWLDMPASDPHWIESFTTTTDIGYPDYTTFPSGETPNGWSLGQGMLVYGNYKDNSTGRAFQMEGQGRGFIEFVDSAVSPRGLESIRFNARLAQFNGIYDFAYYDADNKMAMSNYTFVAAAAFDDKSNTDFSGNATMSLYAYYRPGRGCYEFRVEQGLAKVTSGKVTGIAPRGQILSLYKWTYNDYGRQSVACIGSLTNSAAFNNNDWPSCNGSAGCQPLFISITNATDGVRIVAGFPNSRTGVSTTPSYDVIKSGNFNMICWRDNTASKLLSGTFGVSSANCNAIFTTMYKCEKPVTQTGKNIPASFTKDSKFTNTAPGFPTSGAECTSQIKSDQWYLPPGRIGVHTNTTERLGLRAIPPKQELTIYTAPAGKTTGWKPLKTFEFSSFGSSTSAGSEAKFDFYTTEDCSVKIAAAGDISDVRTDLVIDDLVIRQWRGADWDVNLTTNVIPNWVSESDYKAHTNFVFTSAWITNQTLLLSARRTKPGTPCSIRSPLFDGSYGRGKGLGMIAFKYRNAQENVNLLVQVATNVGYDVVANIDNLDAARWSTVTNFSFAGASAAQRASGSRSCYIGLHDVSGVMRILLDPEVVNAVSNSTDTSNFGDIYIDEMFCRDEPALDASSWWGWNLRTIGANTSGRDAEGRMYLPDLTDDLDKKGLSYALNNSVSDGVLEEDEAKYPEHLPFLQTPTFGTNIVGEVSFRARKYDRSATSQPALVTLYGSKTGDEHGKWHWLSNFVISNTTYSTYSFKTDQDDNYRAFRLAVVGVEGASTHELEGQKSLPGRDRSGNVVYNYTTPTRVLVDEAMVCEAVRARMSFRNVGAFRNRSEDEALNRTTYVANVTDEVWQPLCNESWGVQCEVFAAQLPDEVDLERTPRVKLFWMFGETPWGFDNWRTNSAARSAWLAPATDTNLVYRSSYLLASDAIIPPTVVPGEVVQYGLEVIWYPVGSDVPVTNRMNASGTGWTRPKWYDPVDKNAGAAGWSAYNILDTVAPHWAWINEVNIYGEYDNTYQNSDRNCQYVEVAVPAEADITGWYVQLLEPQMGNGLVVTNTLGVFGGGTGDWFLSPMKEVTTYNASNMSFRVLANEASFYGGRLDRSKGEADAIWNPGSTLWFTKVGEISAIDSIGLRLVRPSGIVEHEIVVRGHDWWAAFGGDESENPTNYAAYLNRKMNSKNFFWVGCDDDAGVNWSLSVVSDRGGATNNWVNSVDRTPGRINVGQSIDPDHPTPNGSSIIVYANLDNTFGHIRHVLDDGSVTNAGQIIFIKRGSDRGTNLVYTVDPWYEIGNVTTNGRPATAALVDAATRRYVLEGVGRGASNNVTVVAGAKVKDSVTAAGVDPRYSDAILDWLGGHKDAWGNDWANPDSDDVRLADFLEYSEWNANPAAAARSQLSLTEMYWLDMDPTMGDLALVAGTLNFVPQVPKSDGSTNMMVDVFMLVTNRTADAASSWYGTNWTPYVLRGMDPGSTSWKYLAERSWRWTNETFNIKGVLQNGQTSIAPNSRNWIALRWFVFTKDSFDPATKTTSIELRDPLGTDTPAFSEGWYDWVQEHGPCPVYLRWAIDEDLKLFTAEPLYKENKYE